MRVLFPGHRWWLSIGSILSVLFLFLRTASLIYACAVDGSTSYQPLLVEARIAFHNAGSNNLGPDYPPLPDLESGYPDKTFVSPSIPCVLLKSIAYVESGWHQASSSVPRGDTGGTLASPWCGYGVMQITSGMRNPGELPSDVQRKIAEDYVYNIGWGAKMLADKWNYAAGDTAVVGNRAPQVAESWYYAVWAYNYWGWKNNPNNPDFPWPRQPFDGSQSKTDYPYQELVWGYAAHPPSEDGVTLWEAVPLSLPSNEDIGSEPGWIDTPLPSHQSPCSPVPMDYELVLPEIRKRS